MGVSAALVLVIISLGVARFHGGYKLGQAMWFTAMGILAASIWPTMPTALHNMVISLTNSILHTKLN